MLLQHPRPQKEKQQHMDGIKRITKKPERFAVRPLPSPVKPDRDKRQKCKALLEDLDFIAEKRKRVVVAAQQRDIQKIHAQKLTKPVFPVLPFEKIERQYRQHAGAEIIEQRRVAE